MDKLRITIFGAALLLLSLTMSTPAQVNADNLQGCNSMNTIGQLYGGTLRIAYGADPTTFNRLVYHGSSMAGISINLVGGRLLTYNPDYSGPVPEMAQSYDVTPDGKTYTFHLRQNITWQNGEKFTSRDVKFYFDALGGFRSEQTGKTANSAVMAAQQLQSIDTPDNYTAVFHFGKFTLPATFAGITGDSAIGGPASLYIGKPVAQSTIGTNPVGAGPFKFVEYVKNDHVTLARFDNYWKKCLPYLDQIIFKIIPSQQTALNALQAGEVDYIHENLGVPFSEVTKLRSSPNYDVQSFQVLASPRLVFNFRPEGVKKYPWLANVKVREAFGHAIDIQGIISKVFYNLTSPSWGPVPKGMPQWYSPKMDQMAPKYDPALANKLLDDAGFPKGSDGVRFIGDIGYQPLPGWDLVAQVIQQNMRQVGVTININSMDMATYLNTYEYNAKGMADHALDIMSGGVGPDPVKLNDYYWYTPDNKGFNIGFYNNTAAFSYLDKGASTVDANERQQWYYKFAEAYAADYPFIWLYNDFNIRAWNKASFKGFRELNAGRPQYFYAPIEKVWWTGGHPAPGATSTASAVTQAPPVSLNDLLPMGIVILVAIVGLVVYMKKKAPKKS